MPCPIGQEDHGTSDLVSMPQSLSPRPTKLARVQHVRGAGRWHSRLHHGHAPKHSSNSCSSTSTGCRRATLALVRATPCLLCNRPTCHPVGESCIAIIWFRRRHAPTALVGATLAVHSAAPLFLRHTPACLPVREAISAIVGICRGRWLCWLAADVVDPAAPRLFVRRPHRVLPNCAIERVDRSRWGRRWYKGRQSGWQSGWHSRWRCGRWRRRLCWERSGRDCRCGLWQSCGRTASSHACTAEVLLSLGPRSLPRRKANLAIVRQRRCHARQQPAEQRDQQQETQKTAARDDASEISPRPHHIEISATSDIFVSRLLHVLTLATTNVSHGAITSATSAADATSSGFLPRGNASRATPSSSTVGHTSVSTGRTCNGTAVSPGWPSYADGTHPGSSVGASSGVHAGHTLTLRKGR